MATADSICRILSASLCAYGINTKDGVKGMALAPDVGFTDAPVATFTAGLRDIDACYVADTDDSVILAFRGTSTPEDRATFISWLNNFLVLPVSVEDIPGKLHKGFSNSVQRLWEEGFQTEVEKRMASGKPLVITGYSKGGALTPIAATFLTQRLNIDPSRINIYLFEPPRPGDDVFATFFNTLFPKTVRYEYKDSIIGHTPPDDSRLKLLADLPEAGRILEIFDQIYDYNYKSVGNLKFVNWDDEIVEGNPALTITRLEHLLEVMECGEWEKFWTDHLPQEHLYPIICGKEFPDGEFPPQNDNESTAPPARQSEHSNVVNSLLTFMRILRLHKIIESIRRL